MRRHHIGDQMPAVTHQDPDAPAIALCRDLMVESDAECIVLCGFRPSGCRD